MKSEQSVGYQPSSSLYNQQFDYNSQNYAPQQMYSNQSSPVPPQSNYYNPTFSYYPNSNEFLSPSALSPTYPTYSNINNYNNTNTTFYNHLQCSNNTTQFHSSFTSSVNNDSAYQSQSEFISPNADMSDLNSSKFVSTPVNAQKVLNKKRKRPSDFENDIEQITPTENVNETVIEVKSKRPKVLKLNFNPQPTGAYGNDSGETESFCPICNLVFYSYAKLLMHQHKFHKNGSSTECPICLKKFGNHANTLVHLRAHTQEKTYKCTSCTQAFCDASTLKKHLRVHSGEKPYACTICTKRFTQSGNLKRHIVVHEKYNSQNDANTSIENNANYQMQHSSNQFIKQKFNFEVKAEYNFLKNQSVINDLTDIEHMPYLGESYLTQNNNQYQMNSSLGYKTTY